MPGRECCCWRIIGGRWCAHDGVYYVRLDFMAQFQFEWVSPLDLIKVLTP